LQEQKFDHSRAGLDAFRIRNPKATSARAFHNALARFRQSVPEGTFLMGCNCLAGSAIGSIDGYRVSDDVLLGYWERNRDMRRAAAQRYYLNGTLWQNDPDVLMVSDKIPIEQARFWASLIALSGSMIMLGDSLPELSDERIDVLRKILPVYGGKGRPLRLFEESYPSAWHLPVEKPIGRCDVVGLYNWYEEPREIAFEFTEIGLEPDKPYALFDFWANDYLGNFKGEYVSVVQPRSCKILSIRERKDIPQLISTQYHITQGGLEIDDERWDSASRTLFIQTTAMPGSVFGLYVGFPENLTAANVTTGSDEVRWKVNEHGLLELEFTVSPHVTNEIVIAFNKGSTD
jgi:hypothetical protein